MNQALVRERGYLVMLTIVASALATGCQSMKPDWIEKLPWQSEPKVVESTFEDPARIAALWTPDVLTQPGSPPIRGFGGRFFFYGQRGNAIPVEGQLVVYGYDDSIALDGGNKHGASATPSRKFVFTPEQFTQHIGDSHLGVSYSIWLPWDPAGGEQKSVSLVPVFTSTMGKIVMGKQATAVLPGRVQPSRPVEQAPIAMVQPVSFDQTVPETTAPAVKPLQMRTTTIPVTPSLRNKMIAAGDSGPVMKPTPAAFDRRRLYAQHAAPQNAPVTATAHGSNWQAAIPADRFARPRYPAPAEPTWRSGPAAAGWRQYPPAQPSAPLHLPQPQVPPTPIPGSWSAGSGTPY